MLIMPFGRAEAREQSRGVFNSQAATYVIGKLFIHFIRTRT
jgi:hypothetical protein